MLRRRRIRRKNAEIIRQTQIVDEIGRQKNSMWKKVYTLYNVDHYPKISSKNGLGYEYFHDLNENDRKIYIVNAIIKINEYYNINDGDYVLLHNRYYKIIANRYTEIDDCRAFLILECELMQPREVHEKGFYTVV